MEKRSFTEFCPEEDFPNKERACLFSPGFNTYGDQYILRDEFEKFGVDFFAFLRKDQRAAEKKDELTIMFRAFCAFIKTIDQKGYEEIVLFGKSFGSFFQLLAMQAIGAEEIRAKIKMICVPAFIDPHQLMKEGNFILPDGSQSIVVHENNRQFLRESVIKNVSYQTLMIIGEEDETQDPKALRRLQLANTETLQLEFIPNMDHFNILENPQVQHQILEFMNKD